MTKYTKFLLIALIAVAVTTGTAKANIVQDLFSGELCNDVNDEIGAPVLSCGETEDIVSFSGFQGGLTPPTGEGLDPSLQRAKNVREFIINTVNFVLTFLSVISLVIIIYGGFLYVTAAGNEEQAGKGKKSIMYAVIGIVIIIASFAIVNTLLTYTGSRETDRSAGIAGTGVSGVRGSGVGVEGTNIGQQSVYNLGASEINAALNNFVSAYKNLIAIDGFIKRAKAVPRPEDRNDNKAYLNEVTSAINQIKGSTNSLSKTHIAARGLLEGWLVKTAGSNLQSEAYENGQLKDLFEGALDESGIKEKSQEDFISAIDDIVGPENPTNTDITEGKLRIVKKVLGAIANELSEDVGNDALQRNLISEKDVNRAFAGIDPNTTIGELFDTAINDLEQARGLAENPENTELLLNVVKSLDRLYILVKDIRFVSVRIRASGREGNAPFIVELNGLDSRDPTGQTIKDENYKWDPDGDGEDGTAGGAGSTANVTCNSSEGPTITCTYNKTGTYVVRLAVASSDPARVAGGQAFLAVTVQPSVARITLKATVGTIAEDYLRKYKEPNSKGEIFLDTDKNEFQVTTSEARESGVTYDASESRGGANEELKNFKWTFGDATPPDEGASKTKISNHKYSREGKFPLVLEVTDRGNRKDRKLVNIIVASIAARIGTDKTISEPDELLEFDGTLSRSDLGAINSYTWKILDKEGKDIINLKNDVELIGDPAAPVLRLKFKNPGVYTIRLTVADGSSENASTEVPISIKSRKPRANFTIKTCPDACPDSQIPSIAEFDASMSFDPDPKDVLNYKWNFFNELGDKLEPVTSFTVQDKTPLEGKDSKKLKVKFNLPGKYKAVLRLDDSLPDDIRQEDEKEKEFEIASTVSARWDSQMKTAGKLENGRVNFTFKGRTENADRVVIDFGDGETSEQSVEQSDNAVPFEFEHEYTRATLFVATLRAVSEQGKGENTITKRIYISGWDTPYAIIEVYVDNVNYTLPEPTPDNPEPTLEIIRNKAIKFDAGQSINSKGTQSLLKYSWDFGDKAKSTGVKVEHSYEDISLEDQVFQVTLTVSEEQNPDKINVTKFPIKVISKKPQVNTLSLEKKTLGEMTPVDVLLTAEGAIDPDGRITNYQFWYYDPADKETKLSVIDTQEKSATLTIETAGAENEEHEYTFCVSVTDNENTVSECGEMFEENELPRLRVKNGPNKAPVAAFTVDRPTVKVGEPIMFTSSSTDEDGRITQYIWDLEGDGFQNDNPTELSTIIHKYDKKSPRNGFRVKLKVVDDKNAAGYSRDLIIHVEPNSNPPIADFSHQVQLDGRQVKFFDSSRADTANGMEITKWMWDFDTQKEFYCETEPNDCNNDKTDDVDSTDQNPIFDYKESGSHQVKLIVEDSAGTQSEPKTALINLSIPGSAGGTRGETPVSKILKAELKTDPNFRFETIANEPIKVLHLPAASNGEPVTFFWGDSTGDIVSYKLDKNIYCDKDCDGLRTNDVENNDITGGSCTVRSTGAQASHCFTTNYQRFSKTAHPRGPGHFTSLLTVVDRNGAIDTENVEIVFDGPTDPAQILDMDCDGNPASQSNSCENSQHGYGASLFKKLGSTNTILLGLITGVIVVLMGLGMATLLSKGKRRI